MFNVSRTGPVIVAQIHKHRFQIVSSHVASVPTQSSQDGRSNHLWNMRSCIPRKTVDKADRR